MSDVLRVGYITAVNYAEGTAQVTYRDRDNAVSPYLPLWSNEYNMPEIDTMVYVLHAQNGGERGMILVPPYTTGNRPPEGIKGIWRKDFGDGSYIRYDYESKKIDIVVDVANFEEINISGDLTVSGKITVEKNVTAASIQAKEINTTGNVHIGGNLTVSGSYPT